MRSVNISAPARLSTDSTSQRRRGRLDWEHCLSVAWLKGFGVAIEPSVVSVAENIWLAESTLNISKGERLLPAWVARKTEGDLLQASHVERARCRALEAAEAVIAAMRAHDPNWNRGAEIIDAINQSAGGAGKGALL